MQHERLWAPWRLGYIRGERDPVQSRAVPLTFTRGADPACFLCQAEADTNDRERLVIERGRHVLTVLNRYPYNNGHLLVATREHLGRFDQVPDEAQLEAVKTIGRMVSALERSMSAEGFNIGLNLGRVAGAGVPGHLHWHIVPRWTGDTNFMPVMSGVDVIPQSLEALWELLTQTLASGMGPA